MEDYLTKKYMKEKFGTFSRPIAEMMVWKGRDDNYPSEVKGSDVYYWFREHDLGYRQPSKEKMVWTRRKPSGKYRIIKKGYVGLRTPTHPDGRW